MNKTDRVFELVSRLFEEYGFPLVVDRHILPDQEDDSTLFLCSGMQRLKPRFRNPDGGHHGSLQSVIRTNDLELVGDGTHLTYFQMLGNFSFGGNDYKLSVELWHRILKELSIPVDSIHCHPSRLDHKKLWTDLGYPVVDDPECEWSDGEVGGHSCEVYSHGVEIGNLVNPLEHSTDVGFGWERLFMILEGVKRVDETSLFNQSYHPIVRDHVRTLDVLWENQVKPGNKKREYVSRRLIRRVLRHLDGTERFSFSSWIESEKERKRLSMKEGSRYVRRNRQTFEQLDPVFFWETFGVLPEELPELGK